MRRHAATGFSFIELMACLAIVATLLLIAAPVAENVSKRRHESELRYALGQMRGAIDRYKRAADTGRIALKSGETGYPPNLRALVKGVVDAGSPKGEMLYFLRRIPTDPFYRGIKVDPEATWGLRSYASPPDAPEAGDDVFDVYSTSDKAGLNGVPYRDW